MKESRKGHDLLLRGRNAAARYLSMWADPMGEECC